MEFDDIDWLRRNSPALRLLRAEHAPLVLGLLGRVFVEENARAISASDLVSRLDDELFALNDRLGEGTFPKTAKSYLEDWAKPEVGWLRKYYPAGSDEVHFDATPAVERALAWVQALRERSFVGTRIPLRRCAHADGLHGRPRLQLVRSPIADEDPSRESWRQSSPAP